MRMILSALGGVAIGWGASLCMTAIGVDVGIVTALSALLSFLATLIFLHAKL